MNILEIGKSKMIAAATYVRREWKPISVGVGITALAILVSYGTLYFLRGPRTLRLFNAPANSPFLYATADPMHGFSALIADKDTFAPNVKATFGESVAEFAMTGLGDNHNKPNRFGNKISFKNIKPDIDLEYETLPNGLKENIILKKQGDGQNEHHFTLHTTGASPHKLTDEGYGTTFYDSADKYIFEFARPYAVDAKGVRTDDAYYLIQRGAAADTYDISLFVNSDWLRDASRSYPVTIDPTVIYNNSTYFAAGVFNRTLDTGSGSSPSVETYYQELTSDARTVGLWHMNEASGNVFDYSGYGNTGTPTGTTVVTGRLGNARNFSGGTDTIAVSNLAVNTAAGAYNTVEFWMKWDGTVAVMPFGFTSYDLYITSSTCFGFNTANGEILGTTTAIPTNTWVHVAAIFYNGVPSATNNKLYIDGVEQRLSYCIGASSISRSVTTTANISGWGTNASYKFTGALDDLRISNVARSTEEIKMDAQRRPYGLYTSGVIDLNSPTSGWNPFTWTELGVRTGDGETLKDATSLVAQWNLNETSGTTVTNNAGNCGSGCNGTATLMDSTASQDADPDSGWTVANKRWGAGALMFDGVDSYVTVPDNYVLSFGNGSTDNSMTIETWIYPRALNASSSWLINKRVGGAGDEYQLTLSPTGQLNVALFSGAGIYIQSTTLDTIAPGNWYHLAMTYDGSRAASGIKLYINGKLEPSTAGSAGSYTAMNDGTGVLVLGKQAWAAGGYFNGIMDSTRLYSRALSGAEVLSNYNLGNMEIQTRVGTDSTPDDGSWDAWLPTSGETQVDAFDGPYAYNTTDTGLIDYWPMDESADNTCTGGVNDICDKKGSKDGAANGPVVEGGVFERGRRFGGSGYIAAGDVSLVENAAWSVEFWAKSSAGSSAQAAFSENTPANWANNMFIIYYGDTSGTTNGGIRIWFTDAAGVGGSIIIYNTSVIDGKWHHVAFVQTSTSSRTLYLDGKPVATDSTTRTNPVVTTTTIGGANNNGSYIQLFKGSLDEVRLYNAAITQATINDHYVSGTNNNTVVHPGLESILKMEGSNSTRLETGKIQVDAHTVGLWHFEETSGTGAYFKDSFTTLANNGTPNLVASGPGISGKAATFNGGSSCIAIANESNFDFERTNSFTIEAWINTSSTAEQHIMSKLDSNSPYSGWEFWIQGTTGLLSAYLNNNFGTGNYISVQGATNLADGKWHHVAMTYDGSSNAPASQDIGLVLYVDGKAEGKAVTSNGLTASILNNITPYIGCRNGNSFFFNGKIDEVRVSNVARSGDEISEVFRLGAGARFSHVYSSTDLSAKSLLPFYIAGDRPGTYLEATIGENGFRNNDADTNVISLWHLDETDNQAGLSTLKYTSTNVAAANAYSYQKALAASVVVATGDTLEYDVLLDSYLPAVGDIEVIYVGGTAARSTGWVDQNNIACASGDISPYAFGKWYHRKCTILAADNGKTMSYIDFVNENDTAAATSAFYDNIVVKSSAGISKGLIYASGAPGFNVNDIQSNASNTAAITNVGYPSTTRFVDVGGADVAGTAVGTTSVPGIYGPGRRFNGTSDYIDLPNSTAFDTQTFTISAWVYSDDFNRNMFIFEKGPVNTQYSCFFETGAPPHLTFRTVNSVGTLDSLNITTANYFNNNAWNHVVCTYDGATKKIYVNGVLAVSAAYVQTLKTAQPGERIGAYGGTTPAYFFNGIIDEVSVSNSARNSDAIRTLYEQGKRTHTVTIDFAAILDSGNLITGSGDTSFKIDGTVFGLAKRANNLYVGDKIIVRENVNGTEYKAQGTVSSVDATLGNITVISWDNGSTFPASGFTMNADVFKWQREYFDLSDTLSTQRDAIIRLTTRVTNGSEGRTVYIDDLDSLTSYLTTSTGSTITSATGKQFLQYRTWITSADDAVSPALSSTTTDFTTLAPNFTPTMTTPTSLSTTSIQWNYNGQSSALDIASSGLLNFGSLHTIANNGDGTFAPKVDVYSGGNKLMGIVAGDFNSDGNMDIAAANQSLGMSVFMNNGDRTFATKVDYTAGSVTNAIAAGDFTGDGKLDLVVANRNSNTASVFINNGNGTFAAKVDYGTGSIPEGIATGDFNADGRADIAVANDGAGTVSVLLNNGNGTFATKVDYTAGSVTWGIATGDLNNDGKADIVAGNRNSSTASVFINNGNGTFAAKVDYGTGSTPEGAQSVAIGDLNSDGWADVAVTNNSGTTVSILLNNGNGTLATKVDYATGSQPKAVAMRDLNGDGKVDLAIGNYGASSVSVLFGNGNGTFGAKTDYTTGVNPYGIALEDLYNRTRTVTGFKLYDSAGSLISGATCNSSSCTETGLSGPNVQYSRKTVSYNANGNSLYSNTVSAYTDADVPLSPTVTNRTPTTASVNPNPAAANPASTEYAIYEDPGFTCDGAGGNYLAANGTSNGSTPIWQTEAAWGTVTASNLSADTAYVFCAKARNGDQKNTAFGAGTSYNPGFVPSSGSYTYTSDTSGTNSFFNRYPDGNTPGRYVIAVDDGASTNGATFEVKSGIMTINSTDTLATGKLTLTGGSVAIAQGGQIKVGSNVWAVDGDGDGISNGKLYVGSQPANSARKSAVTTLNSPDCDDGDATNKTNCSRGLGYDGDCIVNGTNKYLETQNGSAICNGSSRIPPYAALFTSTANTSAGSTTILLTSTPTGLAVGEEVLIINVQGATNNMTNVGQYETKYISAINSNTLTFTSALINGYDGTTQQIKVYRVPHFGNVTVCGGNTGNGCTTATSLVANAWTGSNYGILFFRASGTVTVNNGGAIGMYASGYRGGSGGGGVNAGGQGGESFCGAGGAGNGNLVTGGSGATGGGSGFPGTPSNGGAGFCGGGGGAYPQAGNTQGNGSAAQGGGGGGAGSHGVGGGAGYGTVGIGSGSCGTNASGNANMHGGCGGTYGTATLRRLMMGSGGGKSGDANAGSGANGGAGGGAIAIFAKSIVVSGILIADGQAGSTKASCVATEYSGAGGGGSGGSILLVADTLTLGSNLVHSIGGSGGANGCINGALSAGYAGGAGGYGRIAIKGFSSVSGTTNPTYVSIP